MLGVGGFVLGVLGFALGEVRARRAEKRASRADEVSPWDEARWLSGDLYAVKNSSTRDVIVTAVHSDFVPAAETPNNFEVRHQFPLTVSASDSLEFFSRARYTLSRPGAVIEWHFSGSKNPRSTRRAVAGLNPDERTP